MKTPESFYPPISGRVHEVCGHAATSFAAALCQGKKAIWIKLGHRSSRMHPAPLRRFCNLDDIVFVDAADSQQQLWCMEESLRSGAVQAVVCAYEGDVDFTAARRLQLAAEVGGATGLMIIGEGKGSPVAETRWRCISIFDANHDFQCVDSTLQQWEIIKNKKGTNRIIKVEWNDKTDSFTVVSTVADRANHAPSTHNDTVCSDDQEE